MIEKSGDPPSLIILNNFLTVFKFSRLLEIHTYQLSVIPKGFIENCGENIYKGAKKMIDLHCHTTISDGSDSTKELIAKAKEKGITHLAITNHDTTLGLKEAVKIGDELGVEIIPGIEISAYDFKREKRVHILGYYFDQSHQAIQEISNTLLARRQETSRKMIDLLQENDYEITWEQVNSYSGETVVFKQHIMHTLMETGYCDELHGELYKKLFSREQNKRGIAYVPVEYVEMNEAVKAVKKAGGVPVLAHPGDFDNFAAVPELVEVGLEGLEAKHPNHNQKMEKKAFELAQEFDLITTGGSDYHGFYGADSVSLGVPELEMNSVQQLQQKGVQK